MNDIKRKIIEKNIADGKRNIPNLNIVFPILNKILDFLFLIFIEALI